MNRPLAHRLLSAWLAVLVLTASVGLTVQRHVCRTSGHRTVSLLLGSAKHGCESMAAALTPTHKYVAHSKAQLKAACCEFGVHQHKLTTPSPELAWSKVLLPTLQLPWLPPTCWPGLPAHATVAYQPPRWHVTDSSPPSLAGRVLLTFVCTLVV